MHTAPAIVAGDVQLAGQHDFLHTGSRQQASSFLQDRQSDAYGAARVDGKNLALAKHEDGEFAVDLATDMELRRRNLFVDGGSFQRVQPRGGRPTIVLSPSQQQRVSQCGCGSYAIFGELNFHTSPVEQGRSHWAASSAACSSGALSSRLERCRINR